MRVCRYQDDSGVQVGFYADDTVVSLAAAAERYQQSSGETLSFSNTQDLLALLPAGGADHQAAQQLASWLNEQDEAATADAADDDAMMKRRYRRSRGPSRPRKRNVWGGIGSGGYDGDGGSDSGRTSTWSSSYRRTTTSTPSGEHLPTNICSRRLQGLRAGISMTHLCIRKDS